MPEDDLITLGNKQEALTLAIAKRNSIELDSKTYVEAAKLGLRSTVELVTLISPNKKSYKKNCREVRATFMKNLVAFDLYLSDSPGTNGHPYAFTPWMIVTGKQQPMGMAMVDGKQVLVSDMTDPEGHIVLDEKQQKAVMEAFCRHPDQTWLMSPGQSIQLGTANEDPTWTQYADMRKHRAQRLKNCFTR